MDWIIDNKEWIFSGIGVSVVVFVMSLFIKSKKNNTLNQSSGKNSINIQSANDINIGNNNDK